MNTVVCPFCASEVLGGDPVCACGVDLSVLVYLDQLPDHWFNRTLEANAKGELGVALEYISACCVFRPHDAAAEFRSAR